jgi:hypothetical protein
MIASQNLRVPDERGHHKHFQNDGHYLHLFICNSDTRDTPPRCEEDHEREMGSRHKEKLTRTSDSPYDSSESPVDALA